MGDDALEWIWDVCESQTLKVNAIDGGVHLRLLVVVGSVSLVLVLMSMLI